MGEFITLTADNLQEEHICCAISSKENAEGYQLKKRWLAEEFNHGYTFRKLNARAKVFIEYGSAERAWIPVDAPNYLMINCFWVSGQYKGKGYGKALLQSAIDDAKRLSLNGLVTVVGIKKTPFMSDTKWLLKQGFEEVQRLSNGFMLLALKLSDAAINPQFKKCVVDVHLPTDVGIVVYYSNRCPFTEGCVESLKQLAVKKEIPIEVIKLTDCAMAQRAPTPATIFSLFYNGKFITTDLSICMEKKFDKQIRI